MIPDSRVSGCLKLGPAQYSRGYSGRPDLSHGQWIWRRYTFTEVVRGEQPGAYFSRGALANQVSSAYLSRGALANQVSSTYLSRGALAN